MGQSGPSYSRALNGDKPKKRRKTRVHLYLDEEVVGGLKAEGFSLSALANKLLKEHLERVRAMRSLFELNGGPAGIRTPDLHLVRVAS